MKALIQRVKSAKVLIDDRIFSGINNGILLFICIENHDTYSMINKLSKKIINLRVFSDKNNKMNNSIIDIKGSILIVSQFTLCGNCKSGNRPNFLNAAPTRKANEFYEKFVDEFNNYDICVKTGRFGAHMQIEIINDGPVTFMLEE